MEAKGLDRSRCLGNSENCMKEKDSSLIQLIQPVATADLLQN